MKTQNQLKKDKEKLRVGNLIAITLASFMLISIIFSNKLSKIGFDNFTLVIILIALSIISTSIIIFIKRKWFYTELI